MSAYYHSLFNLHPISFCVSLILLKSNIVNRHNIMCLMRSDLPLMDSLDRPLDLFNVNESLWSDKCDNMDLGKCSNLNPNNMNFIVL